MGVVRDLIVIRGSALAGLCERKGTVVVLPFPSATLETFFNEEEEGAVAATPPVAVVGFTFNAVAVEGTPGDTGRVCFEGGWVRIPLLLPPPLLMVVVGNVLTTSADGSGADDEDTGTRSLLLLPNEQVSSEWLLSLAIVVVNRVDTVSSLPGPKPLRESGESGRYCCVALTT